MSNLYCLTDVIKFNCLFIFNLSILFTGDPACIPLTYEEYDALGVFIEKLRPKLWPETDNRRIFTASYKNSSNESGELSYTAVWHITQKFQSTTGKKMSSRLYRASRVTSLRDNDGTTEEKIHLAKAMNHSITTADRSYDYNNLNQSVKRSLELDLSYDQHLKKSSKNTRDENEDVLSNPPEDENDATSMILRSRKRMAGKNDEKNSGIPGKNDKKTKHSHKCSDKVLP